VTELIFALAVQGPILLQPAKVKANEFLNRNMMNGRTFSFARFYYLGKDISKILNLLATV
jgi:hypothetical protein